MPSLLMIHEVVGPDNAIGKVAQSDVRLALDAGYEVTVIAKTLAGELRPRVTWHKLHVPPRLFYVQWTTARHFIKRAFARALAAHGPFDIIHAHQPQVADLADVFQCHFLTRVAYERHCLEERRDLRSRFVRLQQQGVLHAEDRCYRRWNPRTFMLYDSQLTRQEFHRLYGPCPREDVLVYDCPPLNIAGADERAAARRHYFGANPPGIVAGYLGGMQERKGYKRLLAALAGQEDIHLLFGGPDSERFAPPELAGHIRGVGHVGDISTFYAACDVLLVPSLFEPLGLVAFEAAARGTPAVATPEVGALPHLLEYHAGVEWKPAVPLGPVIRDVAARRGDFLPGITRMAEAFSAENYGRKMRAVYDQVLERAGRPPRAAAAASHRVPLSDPHIPS